MDRRTFFVAGAGVAAAVAVSRWAVASHAEAEAQIASAAVPVALPAHSIQGPNGRWFSHLLPFETFPDEVSLVRALAKARAQHLFI
jgi:hypothetical protein